MTSSCIAFLDSSTARIPEASYNSTSPSSLSSFSGSRLLFAALFPYASGHLLQKPKYPFFATLSVSIGLGSEVGYVPLYNCISGQVTQVLEYAAGIVAALWPSGPSSRRSSPIQCLIACCTSLSYLAFTFLE